MTKSKQVARVDEPQAEAPTAAREVRPLKPDCVTWNTEGFVFREGVVRLPDGVILQDLSEPSLWRVVQGNAQKSLRKLDRLVCISYDESWLVHALVTEADAQSATLSIRPGDVVRPQGKGAMFQTERHTIRWSGAGFAIFRRADDVLLSPNVYASIDAAKHALYREFETIRKVS